MTPMEAARDSGVLPAKANIKKDTLDIEQFIKNRDSDDLRLRKEYDDFRDRAAYVYVTGTFPTHLRSFFMSLLRKATRYAASPSSLDQRTGSLKITTEIAQKLDLDNHPMVMQTKAYIGHGFKIQSSRGMTERRPFSKVFMFRDRNFGVEKVTIQADGSVKSGW